MVLLEDNRFEFNQLYKEVFTTKARYILLWGGRARGGSHFGTDYYLYKMTQPEYFRGAIMRAVYSDIKSSLWQDWKDRLENSSFREENFTINDRMTATYKLTGNGFVAKGFKKSSSKQSAKLKSLAGMTHILIEEAEEVEEADFDKLDDSLRTNKVENIQIILLFNPPSKNHWIMRRFFNLEEWDPLSEGDTNPEAKGYYKATPKANTDALIVHSTYLDNISNLNATTIKKYRAYGNPNSPFYDPEKYYVDVKGLVPEGMRGRIYKGWKPVTYEFFRSLPYPSYYGLDFGYSDDPVALVEIKSHNNMNFWHQVVYEPGLTNPALSDIMKARGVDRKLPIYADSAEPKSIQELKDLGWRVLPADKGPDTVLFGIKQIKSMQNYYTETSKNLIKENQEYQWELGPDKEPTNVPKKGNDHIKDAGRYAITTHRGLKRKRNVKTSVPEARSELRNPIVAKKVSGKDLLAEL